MRGLQSEKSKFHTDYYRNINHQFYCQRVDRWFEYLKVVRLHFICLVACSFFSVIISLDSIGASKNVNFEASCLPSLF